MTEEPRYITLENEYADILELLLREIAASDGGETVGSADPNIAVWAGYRTELQLLLRKHKVLNSWTLDRCAPSIVWNRPMSDPVQKVFRLFYQKFNPSYSVENWEIGMRFIHLAARRGCEPVVRILLESGVDVQNFDGSGRSALQWAARNGHEAVARLLVEAGANPEEKNKWSETALSLAEDMGYKSVADVMKLGRSTLIMPLFDSLAVEFRKVQGMVKDHGFGEVVLKLQQPLLSVVGDSSVLHN